MAENDGRRRERILVEIRKTGMRVRLVRLAGWRTHSPQNAEDLVQTPSAKVYNLRDSPCDRDGTVSSFKAGRQQISQALGRPGSRAERGEGQRRTCARTRAQGLTRSPSARRSPQDGMTINRQAFVTRT